MNDDSEDVFRRAAENYPLNTDNPDWNSLLKKLDGNKNIAKEPGQGGRGNYKFLLLLLFLLSLTVIEIRYPTFFKHNDKTNARKDIALLNKTGDGSKEDMAGIQAAAEVSGSFTLATKADNSITVSGSTATGEQSIEFSKQEDVSNTAGKYNSTGNYRRHSSASKQKAIIHIDNAQATGTGVENVFATKKNNNVTDIAGNDKVVAEVQGAIATDQPDKSKAVEPGSQSKKNEIVKSEDKTSKADIKKDKRHQKHFYIGAIAGPDFSAIKLQSVKKTGYSFGLVAGYNINKKLSVETGFLLDKKLYKSDGEYFNTKNIYVPSNCYVESVNGACHMFEIPVNIYYNFSRKEKSGWFAAAGFSSYLMKKESYVFDVEENGTEYPYAANYKSHDNKFFAVVNLSAGYTHRLGKLGDLRLEPYIKLPVSKIGTGKLPIQSGGLLVGFTKTIF